MIIYLDAILLMNFGIDALLLWTTAYFRKRRPKRIRLIFGALFGAGYVVFAFLPQTAFLYTFGIKMLWSAVMIFIVFGYHKGSEFIQNGLMFYFVSFVAGGGIMAAHYLLQTQGEIWSGVLYTQTSGMGDPVTWTFVVVGMVWMGWFTKKSYGAIQAPRKVEAFSATIRVDICGKQVWCQGMVDTGNRLYEPVTRIPVMIMESVLFQEIFPASVQRVADARGQEQKIERLEHVEREWAQRVRMIPYRTVAQGMDVLIAIKPDKVVIVQEERTYDIRKVLIGLNPDTLASDGRYQGIIHPDLLQNDKHVSSTVNLKEEVE